MTLQKTIQQTKGIRVESVKLKSQEKSLDNLFGQIEKAHYRIEALDGRLIDVCLKLEELVSKLQVCKDVLTLRHDEIPSKNDVILSKQEIIDTILNTAINSEKVF